MNHPVGRYTIRQVAELTKLSTQVIRKWEERYDLVKPQRLSNGYRIYSPQDVEILLKVKGLIDQNHSLQTAILTVKEQDRPVTNPVVHLGIDSQATRLVERMIEAGEACDEGMLMRLLQSAHYEYPLHDFLHQIVLPLLKEIGSLWEHGDWSEYQEHISSQVVRDYICHLRRDISKDSRMPLILGACLPYEQHEIPIQIILLQAAQKGWRTTFLSPTPAVGAIERVVDRLQPQTVVLSALTTSPFLADKQLLARLDQFASLLPHIRFYLGGKGAIQTTEGKQLKAIVITEDIQEVLRFPRA